MAPMTRALAADIGHFAAARGLELVRFAKGQRKDDVTREYLRRAGVDERGLVPAQVLYVVMVNRASTWPRTTCLAGSRSNCGVASAAGMSRDRAAARDRCRIPGDSASSSWSAISTSPVTWPPKASA